MASDGQIIISATAKDIGVDSSLFDKYLENMDNLNLAIREGGVSFDKSFNVKIAPSDEITEIVYKKGLEKNSLEKEHLVLPYSDPGAPPVLQAYLIANNNFNTMYNYWKAIATGIY